MSAEPLTREERDELTSFLGQPDEIARMQTAIRRYEATVKAAEKRAERLRAALENALASSYSSLSASAIRSALAADDAARGDQ